MRTLFAIIIWIHAIIHALGFLKAFKLVELKALSQYIPKTQGIAWLITAALLVITSILFLKQQKYWWIIGLIALISSQYLIVQQWNEAKFGTLINVLILVVIIVQYATNRFSDQVAKEVVDLKTNSKQAQVERELETLPDVIQKWLIHSGALDKEPIHLVYLEQHAEMLMSPKQKTWVSATAKQHISTFPPTFNWSVNLTMNTIIPVVGRDKFEHGKGEMLIKPFAIIPAVDIKGNEKIDVAALQRYLAEIVWCPTAALADYITWKSIDSTSAKATMDFEGTQGSGIFHFNDDGSFQRFTALRYRDVADQEPTEWIVSATKHERMDGILIPTECHASWKLEETNWTWLKLTVTHIAYDSE